MIGSGLSLDTATQTGIGITFLVYLISFLGLALPIPLLVYRAYAILRASYLVVPDGISITWGFRIEEIPMENVLWVSLNSDLERPLPLPRPRWPGNVTGTRQLDEGREVEFMAAWTRDLVVIATSKQVCAISPVDSGRFLQPFQSISRLGSLNPMTARSVYHTFFVGRVWAARPARTILIIGLVLSIGFLFWISVVLPAQPEITFQINRGRVSRPITTAQFFLLPILNALFFLIDLLLGVFFYRHPYSQPLAYLMWGSSVITSLLFIGAVFLILQNQ